MIIFNESTAPIQTDQVLNVFLSAFLPQGRFNIDQLSDYFNKKIIDGLAPGVKKNTSIEVRNQQLIKLN